MSHEHADPLIQLEGMAAYVLPGEPCPESCLCESENGKHNPDPNTLFDDLVFFVRRARELTSAEAEKQPRAAE